MFYRLRVPFLPHCRRGLSITRRATALTTSSTGCSFGGSPGWHTTRSRLRRGCTQRSTTRRRTSSRWRARCGPAFSWRPARRDWRCFAANARPRHCARRRKPGLPRPLRKRAVGGGLSQGASASCSRRRISSFTFPGIMPQSPPRMGRLTLW